MKKKILVFLLAVILLAASAATAFAVDGSNSSTQVFHVHADSGNAYILLRSVKGVAYVEKHSLWGGKSIKGYKEEDAHGFYYVTVTGPGKSETIHWVPSVTGVINALTTGYESGSTLRLSFPYYGDYTVIVEPMENEYASSTYWLVDRILNWTVPATWHVTQESHCQAAYSSPAPARSGTVNVFCYDERGNHLTNYQQTVSSGVYLAPPVLDGYRAVSGSVYVQLDAATGICDPSTIYFNYAHSEASASLPNLPSGGFPVWLKDQSVERIRPQCGPGYQYAVFASMNGAEKLYKPRDITYLSARFCVGDWVYIEFGYTDNALRFGFFEKSLFIPSVDWSLVPSFTLLEEKSGRIASALTPNNGPTANSGSFSSCRLEQGTAVHACMACGDWYLCRFFNDHTNNYGDVYLWVPGYKIQWD